MLEVGGSAQAPTISDDVMTQSTASSIMDLHQPAPATATTPLPATAKRFFSGSYGVRLVRLFVFNSSFSSKEGEEAKKVVYFHDNTTADTAVHTRYVGLMEAAISFSQSFTTKKTGSRLIVETFFTPCRFKIVLDCNALRIWNMCCGLTKIFTVYKYC